MVHGLPVYLLHPSAESQTNILSGKDLRGILAIVGLLIMKIIRKVIHTNFVTFCSAICLYIYYFMIEISWKRAFER